MKELFELFLLFAKCGVCTFGGGYAMLPILTRELSEKRGWISEDELSNYYAVGQCTPGVIAVNVSTFVGMKRKGVIGAVFSTLGIIFPSLVIITIIAALIEGFADNAYVGHALAGIRAAVCGLVAVTVANLIKKNIKNLFAVCVTLLTFAATVLFDVSAVIVIIATAIGGIVYNALSEKYKNKEVRK
ncbi:MAG: chromate transporter [Clostridia bacterium]|nr:chromate transporter [Clostridia bacterium]